MDSSSDDCYDRTEQLETDDQGDWLPLSRSQRQTHVKSFHTNVHHHQEIQTELSDSVFKGSANNSITQIVNLNEYKPLQAFPLQYLPVKITTVKHDLGKYILGIQFETRVNVYKLHKNKPKGKLWSLTNIQELIVANYDEEMGRCVVSFSINPSSSVGELGEQKLGYALGLHDESKVYLVSEKKGKEEGLTRCKTLESQDVRVLDGLSGPVRHLSFDAEAGEMLAVIYEAPICIVWDVLNMVEQCRLNLKSPGVDCMWHRSEPYKLVVVEQSGVIRMYNTLKQTTIFTINTLVEPIFSAHWSPSNSQLVAIGVNKCAYLFDLSLLNSEAGGKRIETHLGPTHSIKFSSRDREEIATATMGPRPEIRTYQTTFKNSIWTSKREIVQDIEWIHGEPYLMALVGKQLCIYESYATHR